MNEHEPYTVERLFERYFWPLYSDDTKRDLGRVRTVDANSAGNVHILRSLDEVAETFVGMVEGAFGARDLRLDGSDVSVHRLSAALDRERRDRWTKKRCSDDASLLTHVVVHGAVYVGSCAVRSHGGIWQVR